MYVRASGQLAPDRGTRPTVDAAVEKSTIRRLPKAPKEKNGFSSIRNDAKVFSGMILVSSRMTWMKEETLHFFHSFYGNRGNGSVE